MLAASCKRVRISGAVVESRQRTGRDVLRETVMKADLLKKRDSANPPPSPVGLSKQTTSPQWLLAEMGREYIAHPPRSSFFCHLPKNSTK